MSGGAYGIAVPRMDFSGLTNLGKTLSDQVDGIAKAKLTADLGEKIKAGDFDGAAQIALAGGELQTGLALSKMGESRGANKQLADTLGGLFGGGGTSAPGGGGFVDGITTGYKAGADRALPSFADTASPSGSYTANLFKRESNNNPTAQASTSSARGLGQFTEGTWNDTAAKHPELGLTPVGGGQDGRIDPKQMLRATQAFTGDNEAILRNQGLPVTDATRYSLHLLGAAGGPKFVAGAVSNPDAPAISMVRPEQVRANRSIFFDADGRPKSAGAVLASFSASFGGGGQGAPKVAIANNEAQTQALERRMGMMPAQTASADEADLPVAGAQEADFMIPPGPAGGRIMSMPPSGGSPPSLGVPAPHNTTTPGAGGTGVAGVGTDAAEPDSAPPASATAKPGFTMPPTLALARAGLPMQASAAVGRTTPGSPERVQALVRASMIPGISEQAQGVVKTLLANELDQAKTTSDQREYGLAQRQGFQGTFLDYKNALSGNRDEGAKLTSQIQARTNELIRAGLDPNDPANRRYRLTGQMAEEKPDKTPDAVAKVNDALTNWQKYRLPDPNDPANAGYWKDFSGKTLGGQGTTVNVDTKGESEEAKELGKARGKRAGDIEAAAMKAPDQIGKLSLLGSVLDRARTGAFGPAESTVVGFAQAAGIPDATIAKLGLNPQQAISGQAATKLINEAVTGMIGGGGFPANNFSDADRSFLQDIFPKMSNRAEANRLAIEVMKRVQGRNLEFGDGWQEYQQAQREAGKPASVAEYEFNFRKGLRGKSGLFDDLRQEFDALPKGGVDPAAGGGAGTAPPPKFNPSTSPRITMQDAQSLKGADDTAENRQAFDARYGEGAAQFVLKRPAPTVPAAAPKASAAPPIAGSKQAPDGKWYVPDPGRPGKFLEVQP